ncbi:MAG TPA: hypothetical protein VL346_11280 [Acidobacteriaceae bacterium]|nr:hypothetical protein [Acidobacteriaceae bacterium]
MKTLLRLLPLLLVMPVAAQAPAGSRPDPWKALSFLLGRWEAKTSSGQPASASGSYTFQEELSGHVLARHSSSDSCKGPAEFNCDHHDLLYAWQSFPHGPVSAIYFDNEGHVIHYSVSTSDPDTAIFLSDPNQPGPLLRLVYERKGDTMTGKFQSQAPGHSEWQTYLEWSGAKLAEEAASAK